MVITGGSRGIGRATACLAAATGFSVCVGYVANAEAAAKVVAACEAAGAVATAVQVDVRDPAQVKALFDRAAELGPISCLVNNAGILRPMARVDEYTVDRLREVVDVNIIGPFLCAGEAVRRMSTRRGGHGGTIVNVSSIAATFGSGGEFVDYASTKGAIDTMTIGLAKEVSREGIRVNAVRPGLIDTEMHSSSGDPDRAHRLADNVPMGRVGEPDEIASMIVYLASADSSYMTGAIVNVSGGR